MSFFEPLPDQVPVEEEQTKRRSPSTPPSWVKPSEGVLFGVVPFREVIAKTSHICVFVDRVLADTNGLIVELQLHLPEMLSSDRHIDGLFPWGITAIPRDRGAGPWSQHVAPHEQMRFGVLLNDGRKAVAMTRQEIRESHSDVDEMAAESWLAQSAPAPPTITAMGGSGGGTESKSGVWIYTADYADSVTLVLEWPVFDIRETQVTIPGDLIAIGRQEIETLW